MKTKEERTEFKIEYESLNRKLAGLTEEELRQVTGGAPVFYGKKGFGFIKPDSGGPDVFVRHTWIPQKDPSVLSCETKFALRDRG